MKRLIDLFGAVADSSAVQGVSVTGVLMFLVTVTPAVGWGIYATAFGLAVYGAVRTA